MSVLTGVEAVPESQTGEITAVNGDTVSFVYATPDQQRRVRERTITLKTQNLLRKLKTRLGALLAMQVG
jgi:hypothetical protein